MILIPAIDLRGGDVVQLVGGDPDAEAIRIHDPRDVAKSWINRGATHIHVIDLDRALGRGDCRQAVQSIIQICQERNIPVQVGGGLRTEDDIAQILEWGAHRVIIGTPAIQDPQFLKRICDRFGAHRIIVAVDARNGRILIKGWTQDSGRDLLEYAQTCDQLGIAGLLYTDVGREGRMAGSDTQGVSQLCQAVQAPVIASGGIGTLEDLLALREAGAWGAVAGMALYTGNISFEQATQALEEP